MRRLPRARIVAAGANRSIFINRSRVEGKSGTRTWPPEAAGEAWIGPVHANSKPSQRKQMTGRPRHLGIPNRSADTVAELAF